MPDAAAELASSPLLGGGAAGVNAESLMISLVCGEDFEMNKMQSLLETVSRTFGVHERICFGASVDKSMHGRIRVCAMGLSEIRRALARHFSAPRQNPPPPPAKSRRMRRAKPPDSGRAGRRRGMRSPKV